MEFKDLLAGRRSVRKYSERDVPREVVERLLRETLTAPSSRNSRSTRLLVVEDPATVARMAAMRDYGSGFLTGAPRAIVVLGDTAASDLGKVHAAISATVLQLACVDEGLASCWVHVEGRPRRKEEPDGEQAADYLRTFLPIPEGCEPRCVIAFGYSALRPATLPPADDEARSIRQSAGRCEPKFRPTGPRRVAFAEPFRNCAPPLPATKRASRNFGTPVFHAVRRAVQRLTTGLMSLMRSCVVTVPR